MHNVLDLVLLLPSTCFCQVLLDELRTPVRVRSCGASRVWKERVLPVLLADPRLRFAPAQVEGEPKECVRVLSPAALRHAASGANQRAKADSQSRSPAATESNGSSTNGFWRGFWNSSFSPEKSTASPAAASSRWKQA